MDGLRGHGWEEGRNVVFEGRFSGPDPARFPDLAKELVALKVDVILGGNMQAIEAARSATATIPIVIAGVMNPVGLGSVAYRRSFSWANWDHVTAFQWEDTSRAKSSCRSQFRFQSK